MNHQWTHLTLTLTQRRRSRSTPFLKVECCWRWIDSANWSCEFGGGASCVMISCSGSTSASRSMSRPPPMLSISRFCGAVLGLGAKAESICGALNQQLMSIQSGPTMPSSSVVVHQTNFGAGVHTASSSVVMYVATYLPRVLLVLSSLASLPVIDPFRRHRFGNVHRKQPTCSGSWLF